MRVISGPEGRRRWNLLDDERIRYLLCSGDHWLQVEPLEDLAIVQLEAFDDHSRVARNGEPMTDHRLSVLTDRPAAGISVPVENINCGRGDRSTSLSLRNHRLKIPGPKHR